MNLQTLRNSQGHPLDPQTAAFLFSPSARVRHVRKLPSIDDRSLIAAPNDSYKQPVFVLDQAIHLAHDVENLRKEVHPLRQQYELIRSNIDYADEDADIDPLEEMSRREGYTKLHQLQDQCLKLDAEISKMNSAFTDKSRNELNSCVSQQYEAKADFDLRITELNEAIKIQSESLENLLNSELKEKVLKNNDKIKELEELKNELLDEESKLLEIHQSLLRAPPEYSELIQIEANLQRQLKSVSHQHSQKKVQFSKYSKDLANAKTDLLAVIESRKTKIYQERSRDKWARNYKRQVESYQKSNCGSSAAKQREVETQTSQNGSRLQSENKPITEPIDSILTETVIKITRVKRRHKHYHHRSSLSQAHEEDVNSSVSPTASALHCSDIEPVLEANEASYVEMNEEETENKRASYNNEFAGTNDKIITGSLDAETIEIGESSHDMPQLVMHDDFKGKEGQENDDQNNTLGNDEELASDEFVRTGNIEGNESKVESENGSPEENTNEENVNEENVNEENTNEENVNEENVNEENTNEENVNEENVNEENVNEENVNEENVNEENVNEENVNEENVNEENVNEENVNEENVNEENVNEENVNEENVNEENVNEENVNEENVNEENVNEENVNEENVNEENVNEENVNEENVNEENVNEDNGVDTADVGHQEEDSAPKSESEKEMIQFDDTPVGVVERV